MEIMTVVIIVGVIAIFAIPNFTKTMDKSYEQDAITQLTAIHAANDIYKAQNGAYWPADGSHYSLSQINSSLGLSIMGNGMQYDCIGAGGGSSYTCTSTRPSGTLLVTLTQAPLSTANPAVSTSCSGYGC